MVLGIRRLCDISCAVGVSGGNLPVCEGESVGRKDRRITVDQYTRDTETLTWSVRLLDEQEIGLPRRSRKHAGLLHLRMTLDYPVSALWDRYLIHSHVLGCSESSGFRQCPDWPSHSLIGNLDESVDLRVSLIGEWLHTISSIERSRPVSSIICSRSVLKAVSEALGSRGSFSLGPKHCGNLVISSIPGVSRSAYILGTNRPKSKLASVSASGPPFL